MDDALEFDETLEFENWEKLLDGEADHTTEIKSEVEWLYDFAQNLKMEAGCAVYHAIDALELLEKGPHDEDGED